MPLLCLTTVLIVGAV